MNKKCISCNEIKDIDSFTFRKDTDKYRNQCKICVNGRVSEQKKERRKNNSEFIERERAYCKKWREENSEYDSERKKLWRQRNPGYDVDYYAKNSEHMVEQKRIWRKDNPEKVKDINRKYRKNHPETKRASERKRRATKVQVEENYTKYDEQFTYQIFKSRCFNCKTVDNLTIDHHLCLSDKNALTIQNAVVLCHSCNSKKSNKLPKEFYSQDQIKLLNILLDIDNAQ